MSKKEKESIFRLKMEAEFEKIAVKQMITVSDNSQIKILKTKVKNTKKDSFNLIVVPGWASIVLGWDEFLMRAKDYFNVYYLETREKKSSILAKKSKYTVDRISSDLGELIEISKLDPEKTIFFGSSFGAIVLADALCKKKIDPYLTVLVGPPEKIDMPPIFRYLLFIVPAFIYRLFAPIGKFWIRKSKSESPEQAAKYIRVIDEGDAKKWKKFCMRLAFDKYWDTYAGIESRVLVVDESEDKLHRSKISKRIAASIKNSELVDLKTNEFTHSAGIADFLYEKISKMS